MGYLFRDSFLYNINVFLNMRIILIISLFLISCHEEKIILHKWDTYKIKEGKHSSGTHVMPFTGNALEFDAIFDQSAIYKIEPANQTDINKLLGFSDCNSMHHENSARFGWNWTDSLNIYAYCYSSGKVNHKYITSINLNKVYRYSIYKTSSRYLFCLDGKSVWMERNNKEGSGYVLFPYFGGTELAPHDIKIKLLI